MVSSETWFKSVSVTGRATRGADDPTQSEAPSM
jgi:hypothetical protein